MAQNYIPRPVDTTGVILPPDVEALGERIAEHAHDNWAAGRMAQGWTYGETRNDERKETPCLIPYSELPESEKEYDRNTAMGTLKLLIALGYSITKTK